MRHPLTNAAPIQGRIIDRPWQVVNHDGFVISHCASRRTADATAAAYPGTSVRYVG